MSKEILDARQILKLGFDVGRSERRPPPQRYLRSEITCQQSITDSLISNQWIAVRKVATPLQELTCHMGSHSVTCHPAEATFPPLPQPKLVLD